MKNNKKLLYGHRGTSLMAPENTATAFDFALQHKADRFETDVRVSGDGVVMVTHDETLDRTTNGNGLVREHTLTQLKQLDAGYRLELDGKTPFRGQQIRLLTLTELFQQYPDIGLNIDIKDASLTAADAVLEVIEDCNTADRTIIASFHSEVINHVRKVSPSTATSATPADLKRFYWQYLLLRRGQSAPGYFQIPANLGPLRFDSRRLIRAIQQSGAEVHYWTINDPIQARELLDRGADAIVTDRADLIAPVM